MAYTATGSGGATGTDATASLKDEKIDYISLGQVIEGRLNLLKQLVYMMRSVG